MIDPVVLSDDFHSILDRLESSGDHAFITGRAGTGKSTLLQLFRNTTKKKCIVLGPTGVSALHIGGMTIHSFFGFPPRLLTADNLKVTRNSRIIQKIDMIIIDEISMVRADLLDCIDYALRVHRKNNDCFGGVQMVFFGDLFQLPPVVATDFERQFFVSTYESPYFFSAKVFAKGLKLETFELKQVYRQDEQEFLRILEAMRCQEIDEELLSVLNHRVVPQITSRKGYITLTTQNQIASRINREELVKIDQPLWKYTADISGQFNAIYYPTEPVLTLKEGAQVMFIRNDPSGRFVNGSLGVVYNISDDGIKVKTVSGNDEKIIEVVQHEWEVLKYTVVPGSQEIKTEILGSFKQYPLRLAWAITVHKSQGKTFDRVIINLGKGAFEHGQTYVALSRCRTLQGILLAKPIRYQDVLVDERIVDFQRQMRW